MSYKKIEEFSTGFHNISNDPLTYCLLDTLDSQFINGTTGRIFGRGNRQCAIFMSNRCAEKWDNICEIMSTCDESRFPDMANNNDGCHIPTTAGNLLVRDTAYLKYLLNANGSNVQCEPFDPTVADSPTICYINHSSATFGDTHVNKTGVWDNGEIKNIPCAQDASYVREYGLTEEQIKVIDKDPVMNKLIDNPNIAPELLKGIYWSLHTRNQLPKLKGTRLGYFFGVS